MEETKCCTQCKRILPRNKEYFFGDKYRKDGLKGKCKECEKGKEIFGLPKGVFDVDWNSIEIKSGIYKITNLVNNKIYIGSAINFTTRWSTHIHELRKNSHGNSLLQNSFNKYGEDNFKFEMIEFVEDKNRLLEREQCWIDKTNCTDKNIGFNILKVAGSSIGKVTKEETKIKLRGNNTKSIIQLTTNGEFIKEWLSGNEIQRELGYKSTNISRCANHLKNSYKGYLWIFKEEYDSHDFDIAKYTIDKKTILQYDKTGIFIKEWDAPISEISKVLNIKDSNISQCCKGKQPTAGNYVWRFRINDENFETKINVDIKKNKQVLQLENINGELKVIKEWNSLVDASNGINTEKWYLKECVYNKRESHLGFIWKFKKDFIEEVV